LLRRVDTYMATGELSLSLANSAIAASPANVYATFVHTARTERTAQLNHTTVR